ncbi:hypothetical protein V1527DRAFT_479583 [Lipomyces starkeyi]
MEKKSDTKEFSIPTKEFTLEEVSTHNKKTDCWVVFRPCYGRHFSRRPPRWCERYCQFCWQRCYR